MKRGLLIPTFFLLSIITLSLIIATSAVGPSSSSTNSVSVAARPGVVYTPDTQTIYNFPPGFCSNYYGSSLPSGACLNLSSCKASPPQECMNRFSETSCTSDSNCSWSSRNTEFLGNNIIKVNKGWNLLWGLVYPGEIYNGSLKPDNVKEIQAFDPFTKKYFELYPNSTEASEVASIKKDTSLAGYVTLPGSPLAIQNGAKPGEVNYAWPSWVYFNTSGTVQYKIPSDSENTVVGRSNSSNIVNLLDPFMIKGWNFIGITPYFFYDSQGNSQNSFTIYNLGGSCNLNSSTFYLYTGGNSSVWKKITPYTILNKSELSKVIVANFSSSCVLGHSDHSSLCASSKPEGQFNKSVKDTVYLKGLNGNMILNKTDSCQPGGILYKYSCSFEGNGTMTIRPSSIQCNCVNGACVN